MSVAPATMAGQGNRWAAAAVAGFFVLITLGTYATDARYLYFSAYLWFGFIYGASLQYGRFCMASAIRDLFAVGVPRMAVGIMIAVVLFSLVSAAVTVAGKSTFHASPIGLYSVVGGAIFGFGMVFTGGCATGSLYKTGEGSVVGPARGALLELRAGPLRGRRRRARCSWCRPPGRPRPRPSRCRPSSPPRTGGTTSSSPATSGTSRRSRWARRSASRARPPRPSSATR